MYESYWIDFKRTNVLDEVGNCIISMVILQQKSEQGYQVDQKEIYVMISLLLINRDEQGIWE